jgi:penicillin-binding protein 1B
VDSEGLQTRPAAPRGLGVRAFAALRLRASFAWLRFRRAFSNLRAAEGKRRLRKAILVTASVGALAITTEALIRGHIVSPAARAPSALLTRRVAWGTDEDGGTVTIGPLDPALNEQRIPVTLRDVPQHLIDAVLAVEDKRFHEHHGFDPRRIAGALVANVRAVGISEGGSTITQQLAKNLFLTADRTPIRKLREAALAAALEIRHTKREILEAYLNEIYLGRDGGAAIHGVGAAARYYFGKPVSRLSLSESALLAGMIRSPNRLAPTRHPRAARERRNLVIGLMVAQKRVGGGVAERARDARVPGRTYPMRTIDARYFRDFVSSSLNERMPARGGAVYSTLDATLQRSAERAVVRGLQRMRRPGAQASLVAIDPRTGDILAMVGGRDYGASQFNRAVSAKRQPGSTFKPFVALAALESGGEGRPAFTLASRLEDEPLRVAGPSGDWQPVNYDGQFRGEVTLREALEQSLNVPIARVGLAIGPERIAATAKRLGVTSTLAAVPSLALGSSEVTLLELVRAYGVLATQGDLAETRAVTGRVGSDGTQRDADAPSLSRVADPATTFLVTSALIGAVQRGTGVGLQAGRFVGDVAGKTGTSSDWRDAWFVAYAPNIVVGVWVGYDDGRSLGLAGGAAAVPIVSEFFSIAEAPLNEPFRVPAGIEEGYSSGGDWRSCGQREYFLAGTAPNSGGCGFRALADGLFDDLRDGGGRLQRMILNRIREELEARQHRR